MSRRTWLVSVSILGHIGIGVGLFASGIWKLEKLESDHRLASIGIMTPSMGGSPAAELPAQKFQKKQVEKTVVKNVQWDKKNIADEKKVIAKVGGDGDGEGEGKGDQKGDSLVPGDGTCALPPCDEAPQKPTLPEKLPEPEVKTLAPQQLSALRLFGETQIQPSRNVKNQILNDGKSRVATSVKLCISTTGGIASTKMFGSTGYPEYDRALLDAVQLWRYRPYTLNGVPAPACSMVSFVYTIK